MKPYECKRVENCFSSAHMYEYRLPLKAKEDFVEELGKTGVTKYYRNFPRPCFQIQLADGATIKGVISDIIIKVNFPVDNARASQEKFEQFLSELLEREWR